MRSGADHAGRRLVACDATALNSKVVADAVNSAGDFGERRSASHSARSGTDVVVGGTWSKFWAVHCLFILQRFHPGLTSGGPGSSIVLTNTEVLIFSPESDRFRQQIGPQSSAACGSHAERN